MQSPGLRDVSRVCFNKFFAATPFFMSLHEPRNPETTKQRSSSSISRQDFATKTVSSFFPNFQFTNHESLPALEDSLSQFNKAYPQYLETNQIDKIRALEYYHLSLSNHVCLDYIGIGLFSHYQLQYHHPSMSDTASSSSTHSSGYVPLFSVSYKSIKLKTQLLYGSPESKLEASIRKIIMDYLSISETDYSIVFTANRTAAFKILAESYPFRGNQKLLTVYDYESAAVEGLISSSEKRGARVFSAEFKWPRLNINSAKLKKVLVKNKKKKGKGLFVFPLQSRMSGARYPYIWMRIAQENGWHVLLDACALGPKDMDCFGISLIQPDFIISSFYNVFGEDPSGFGCLIIKKSTIPLLEDTVSTGIVTLDPVKKLFQLPAMEDEEDDEIATSGSSSGPISILNAQSSLSEHQEMHDKARHNGKLLIKCSGLDHIDAFGRVIISNRARYLINWLVNALMKLQHPFTEEHTPLVNIYGPKIKFDRAPALAFNIFDWKGDKVDPVLVQKLADRNNISLSYGFLHQIWFSDKYEHEKERVLERREKIDGDKRKDKTSIGITVVTAALGFLANFEDVYRVWIFFAQFLDADFVEKERWRYKALNQKTIEM